MAYAVSKQTIDMPGPYSWDIVRELKSVNGGVVAVRDDGQTLQQMPNGGRKFDSVSNPGSWETAKLESGTLTYWPERKTPAVFLVKELP